MLLACWRVVRQKTGRKGSGDDKGQMRQLYSATPPRPRQCFTPPFLMYQSGSLAAERVLIINFLSWGPVLLMTKF
jgi:hypothetical protein